MITTVIVVPCYNEESRLPVDNFRRFAAAQSRVRFLMVNDGSEDGTVGVLRRLQSENPGRFEILNLPRNLGKAEAVRRGCCAAMELQPRYIGYWDADLAAPLDAITQFHEVLDRCPNIDLVLGSRIPLMGHAIKRGRLRRRLGRLFAWTAATVLGLPIYDTQAGHKLFRVSPRLREIFATEFQVRWIFDVELLARWIGRRDPASLEQAGRSIFELPLEAWQDVVGSKLKWFDFVTAFFELAQIATTYLRLRPTPPAVPESSLPSPRGIPIPLNNG